MSFDNENYPEKNNPSVQNDEAEVAGWTDIIQYQLLE